MDKVRKGLDAIEKDRGLTHEEAEERLSKWLVS
jgi:predicted transcriptional regulator